MKILEAKTLLLITTSGAASDTTSLSSSVSKFRFENGRRYHGYKDGLYMQPNDEQQLSVQDLGYVCDHLLRVLITYRD